MWKLTVLAVTLLLLVFVRKTESWSLRRRRRYSPPPCPRNCEVSSWSAWRPCTHQCGTSGTQTKTRFITSLASCGGVCPYALSESQPCNRGNCHNSGTPTSSGCSCRPGYQGRCCEFATTRPPVTNSPPVHFANFLSFSNGKYNISWMYNSSTDRLHFVTEVMTTGWVGFGFATQAPTGMRGYDVAVGGVLDGVGYLRDFLTVGRTTPRVDTRQDWKLTYSREESGKTTLMFYRQRNTTDQFDVAIQPGVPIFLIWAYHPTSDTLVFHGSINRGFQSAVLIPPIATPSTPVGPRSSSTAPTSSSSAVIVASTAVVPVTTAPPFNVTVASSLAISPTPSSSVIAATSTPVVPTGCGGSFTGLSGSFASPGYPFNYSNNLNCLWTLSIPANGSLRLQFIVFETESCCDFVELMDIFGGRIDRISGSRSGFNVTVRGDRTALLRVIFTTDRSVTTQGFLAQYRITFVTVTSVSSLVPTPASSAIVATSSPVLPTQPPIIGCGGELPGSSGLFGSPGYPGSYTNRLNCLWTLRIPVNGFLRLQFIVFETEQGFDFVDLTDSSGQRIERLDGSRSGFAITVGGNRTTLLNIRLITDGSVVRLGFLAQYTITVVQPSATGLPPVMSSSAVPPVTIPSDVRRVLVDLLRSLCQIIQRLQELLGGSFSSSDFENFRNQTLQILQQAENQLTSSGSSQLRGVQIGKRSIPELSTPQEMVEMLENIQRKLLG